MSGIINTLAAGFQGLVSSLAQDVVAVYDLDFEQIFRDARPLKATVKETAKLMQHPVETGALITDHRVINPIEIDLSMVLTPETYRDTYYEIKDFFLGLETIIVQTSTDVYEHMLINDMPHEENPEHFDTITMVIKLREVIFVKSSTSELPVGNKEGKPATPTVKEETTGKADSGSVPWSIYKTLTKEQLDLPKTAPPSGH